MHYIKLVYNAYCRLCQYDIVYCRIIDKFLHKVIQTFLYYFSNIIISKQLYYLKKINSIMLLLKSFLERSTIIDLKIQELYASTIKKNLIKYFSTSKLPRHLQKLLKSDKIRSNTRSFTYIRKLILAINHYYYLFQFTKKS